MEFIAGGDIVVNVSVISGNKVIGANSPCSWLVNEWGIVVGGLYLVGFHRVEGGTGFDTLTGPPQKFGGGSSNWVINSNGGGTVTGYSLPAVEFSGIESIVGSDGPDLFEFTTTGQLAGNISAGQGDDRFVFTSSGQLAGTINGGEGTDTLDLGGISGQLEVLFGSSPKIPGVVNGMTSVERVLTNRCN